MVRTLNTSERNLQTLPPHVVVVPANTPTLLLQDSRLIRGEIAYRRIQNVGENNLFVSFGITTATGGPQCDGTTMFHKVLVPMEELDCSSDRQIVSGFSVNGTVVATELRQRL